MPSTLGELMVSRAGSVTPADHATEIFDLYSIPAFDRGESELMAGAEIGSAKQVVRPGDVLLSKIVPHIRRAWIVGAERGHRLIASGEWIVFRGSFHPPYLRHFLQCDLFHRQFMNTVAGVGGSLLRARPAFVKEIPVPLPPIEEQRRIADILDRADALRAKRREALALLDDLTQSIFLDMFGDQGESVAIGDLAQSTQYGTSAKAGGQGEWPVLRMGNVTAVGRLDLTDLKYLDLAPSEVAKYTVRRGDLLFNRTNSADLVGKTCVVDTDEPLAFAGYLVRVRFEHAATSTFVSGYLNSRHGKKVLRGMAKSIIGQANINATEMCSIRVPDARWADQEKYAARINAVNLQRAAVRRAESVDDELFASLQQRAFAAEL